MVSYPKDMWRLVAAWFALSSALVGCQGATIAHLDSENPDVSQIRSRFEAANPGYRLQWETGVSRLEVSQPSLAFVQSGEGTASGESWTFAFGVGDLFRLDEGMDPVLLDPPADLLIFGLPHPEWPIRLYSPILIRPDWDEKITNTPGGCAAEEEAYRRILLTWQESNGPYLSHQINAHRVRIRDSFTHYHPVDGGFDEFYLVQMVQPGGCILTSPHVKAIESRNVNRDSAAKLIIASAPRATRSLTCSWLSILPWTN